MTFTELDLHAYVDGQLERNKRVALAREILASEELQAQIRTLQSLKRLVRLAYRTSTTPRDADPH